MSDVIWANCPNCGDRHYWGHSWISVHGWKCCNCVSAGADGQRRRYEQWQQRIKNEERQKEEEKQRLIHQAQEAARQARAARQAAEQSAKESQKRSLSTEIRQIESNMGDVERELRRVVEILNEKMGQFESIQLKMALEESKLVDFSAERSDPSTKTLVLLGMTGEGKSTLGNRLCGDVSEEGNYWESPFGTSIHSDSKTQKIHKHTSLIYGERLCVVDTPGLEDSYGREREHVNNLISWLRGCGGINQFYLVKMAGNPRFHEHFKRMLSRLEVYFGTDFWRFVTIVLTKLEGRDIAKFEQYSQDLSGAIQHEFGCPPVKVVGIGFDGYRESLQQIVCALPDEKFQCENLTSPVDELRKMAQELEGEVDVARRAVSVVEERLQKLVNDKKNAERNLSQLG